MSPEEGSPEPTGPGKGLAFDHACRFLFALVAAVQRYGVSSSAMESMLGRVAEALHVRGQFRATPTQVQSIVWEEGSDQQRIHISVLSTGNYDLTKLTEVSELVGRVALGAVAPDAGLERLRAIDAAGPENGPWFDAAAFVLCGLGFGGMLGLYWLDVLVGGALSIVSFGLARLATRSQGLGTTLELVVTAMTTALATLLALVLPGSNPMGVAVCTAIYFVPGFGFTLGASELMNGNTGSGLIGFTRALVTSGKLLIGALAGHALVSGWATVPPQRVDAGVPHVWTWLFVPMLVLGLAILFRVRRRELIWPVLGGVLVWVCVTAGAGLGAWQGTFLGAFVLMFASRQFARLAKLPAVIILLPAVMVLVPGVSALQALYVAQTQGLAEGLHSVSVVFEKIGAILGGTLLGEAAWSVNRVAVSTVASRLPGKGAGREG